VEGKLNAVRRTHRQALLKIGVLDTVSGAPVEEVTRRLSELADACARTVLEIVLDEIAGDDTFPRALAVPQAEALLGELRQARGVQAAVAAGSTIGILIDVDEGMHRCGVADSAEALALARHIAESPGLQFLGLTGYEGHCSLEFDPVKRQAMAGEAMALLTGIAADLAAAGLPCQIVSAAGTGTWEVTSRYPGVTEIQPGSYATMDGHHRKLDPRFGWAVTVLASVISRRSDRIVTDAGSKTVGASHGILKEPDLEVYRFDEEHSIFLADDSVRLTTGDRVEILCNYTPFAIGYFEAYHVIDGGRVVDVWPVMPRGPESRWLLDMLERGE